MEQTPYVSLKTFDEAKEYWLSHLDGELKEIKLAPDRAGQALYKPVRQPVNLGKEITAHLLRMGKNNDLSLYILLLTSIKIMIYKLTGESDIIVASPTRGENIRKYNRFVAFRDFVNPDMTFRDLLMAVRETVINGYKNQHYPIRKLMELLAVDGSMPFFRVLLLLENMHPPQAVDDETVVDRNDIAFSFLLKDTELIGHVIYNSTLFTSSGTRELFSRYRRVLIQIIEDRNKKIGDIELIGPDEKEEILYHYNTARSDFPERLTVHGWFEEQVSRTLHHIAVVYGERQVDYNELNRRSGCLAAELRARGVVSGSIAGIYVERSISLIIGIIAILKAGGAYLPVDPDYPADRIRLMLQDSGVGILLTHPDLEHNVRSTGVLNVEEESLYLSSGSTLERGGSSEDLLYIIYTSGSTGRPKGVLIRHRGFVNLVCFHRKLFGENEESRLSQVAGPAFDAMAFEIWPSLLSGAALYIAFNDIRLDPAKLKAWLLTTRISISFQPTALAELLLDEDWPRSGVHLRVLRTAGDRLTRFPDSVYPFDFYNLYGPTEDTVWSTWEKVAKRSDTGKLPPIGKPIDNHQIFILSDHSNLQPAGVTGELCIGGEGLAVGYLNSPELTARKFSDNPVIPGERIYRTGDLAQWLLDGTIDFQGRSDNQVKIRGFRIEPGEIENLLTARPDVKDVVVLAREGLRGDKRLIAYFVPRNDHSEDLKSLSSDLRGYLSETLPDYMIPSHFIPVDRFPMTPNGKVDKKALLAFDTANLSEFTAPRDWIESRLARLWSAVLGIDQESIGIDANFFELGGHSLNANIAAARVHKAFNVKISLGEIFENPTIRGLAEYIKKAVQIRYVSIEAAEKREYYPMSSAQERLFVLQQMAVDNVNYNIPAAFVLEGHVEKERLEITFNRLIERHESLRTSFETLEEEPVQRIHEGVQFEIEYLSFSPAASDSDDGEHAIVGHFIRPFDLSRAPLLRVGIISPCGSESCHQKKRYILMIDMHHIISDGTSVGIMIKDFTALYGGAEVTALHLQYRDFSQWKQRGRGGESLRRQEDYWVDQFKGEIPVLNLPIDYPRPQVQSFEGKSLEFELAEDDTAAVKALALKEDATLFMVLLAAYTILLSKICGQEDIIVGTPVAGRSHADLQQIIGMFVNTLGLRNFPYGPKTFREFLREVKERTLAAFDNQEYQFEDLVEKTAVYRDASRNPLFDVMFALQNLDIPEIYLPELTVKPYEYDNRTVKFDLNIMAVEGNNRLYFVVSYCTKLFHQKTIGRVIEYYRNVLSAVLEGAAVRLSEISIMTSAEKAAILFRFNETEVEYPRTRTVHELCREQADANPGYTALEFEDYTLTYGKLDRISDLWAGILTSKGVSRNRIVGIMLERSPELIIGILSILKAGGAYLPIDIHFPVERKRQVLADSAAGQLITRPDYARGIQFPGHIIDLPELQDTLAYGGDAVAVANRPEDIAYVIYTSGSTGRPKGVLVNHGSLANLITFQQREFHIEARDRILQFSTNTFDASVEQIFSALCSGSVLILVTREVLMDQDRFESYACIHRINHIHAVPSFLESIQAGKYFRQVKRILSGGEVCPLGLARTWSRRCDFFNKYGPSETTVTSVQWRVDRASDYLLRVPIGRPIGNTKIFILDPYLNPVPVGVSGELYIGGRGVARGYLNQVERTAEMFIGSRYIRGERLYRSGDLGRWLPSGLIEFLGRIDQQVKIRGFRIEPGEIESHLRQHPQVRTAAVIPVTKGDKEKLLCAYIVPASAGKTVTAEETNEIRFSLREYLSHRLPDYMIPSYFLCLDAIPLTSTGKVNRSLLPPPHAAVGGNIYIAPRNEVQSKLIRLWSDLLGVEKDRIGITANFFELGGHSLKATLLLARIHREFDVKVPLAEIFKTPTIEKLGEFIERAKPDRYSPLKASEEKDYYPLSSAQMRLYVLQQLDPASISYNVPAVLVLEGRCDLSRLEEIFRRLIRRHETLRSAVILMQNVPVQHIRRQVEFDIEYHDLAAGSPATGKSEAALIAEFIRPFNLAQAPLLRVGLIRGQPGESFADAGRHLLLVDMHHIVSDGTSLGIFIKEFISLYRGKEPAPLNLQYRDYAEWQYRQRSGETFKQQECYWLDQFKGEIPVLNLPTDYPRPWVKTFTGGVSVFDLGRGESINLTRLALKEGTTPFMPLLAIFNILMARLSGQEDIVVGTPVAGRRHADLQPLIGMFVNTLAMRNFPGGDRTFLEFLQDVKERTLAAFENQDYQFEDLVGKVAVRRDASRNPLFDVVFAWQNIEIPEIEIPGLKLRPYGYKYRISKFDLTFMGIEEGENIKFTVEYSTKLFKGATIDRLQRYFKQAVASTVGHPGQKIAEIEIVPPEEKRRLLYDFNDTDIRYSDDPLLHRLIEAQVKRTPDRIVVVGTSLSSGDSAPVESFSYKALNDRANRLAGLLISKGISPDTAVGILIERSLEMAVGLIGILKAGGAYLPVDPGYPDDRIAYILQDSGVEIFLGGPMKNPSLVESFIDITAVMEFSGSGGENPMIAMSPKNAAYIIYTSGSTGRPKGAVIEHRSVVNTLLYRKSRYDLGPRAVALQLFSNAFDGFVTSFFTPIISGASIVILSEADVKDITRVAAAITLSQVTHLICIPVLFQALQERFKLSGGHSLEVVTLAGDSLLPGILENAGPGGEGYEIAHEYGVTEAAVMSTLLRHQEKQNTIMIGKPTGNTRILIGDRHQRSQPIGIWGEICISGVGLARGYLNNPELTSEKFYTGSGGAGNRSYRSGDIGRWLPDGNIEFSGRIDNQVKVRGFRIEPGEIETQLLKHRSIGEAVVVLRPEPSGDRHHLYAYYTADRQLSTSELRQYLGERLPDYMIPAYFFKIDHIPLTAVGKIDRDSLPVPDASRPQLKEVYVAPQSDVEKSIAAVWKEVLNLEQVGIDDNYFDLGGNSLNILQVNNKLNEIFEDRLPLMTMFRYTTIRSQALYLAGGDIPAALDRESRSQTLLRGKSDRKQRLEKRKQIKAMSSAAEAGE